MAKRRVRRTSAELDAAAKTMRVHATCAETALWELLRAGRLDGHKFRRQHAVGRFVLDFYCPAARLCIEVDGPIHDTQKDRDAARDAALASYNVRVLRVSNEEVLFSPERVLSRVLAALADPPLAFRSTEIAPLPQQFGGGGSGG